MVSKKHRPLMVLTAAATLLLVGGCATLKLPPFKTAKPAKADARNPVTQVVCIWQPAEGRGLDEMPSRGFAGQIVFLTANSPTPVEVEGNVSIYLFDDQAPAESQSRPLHVAHFVDGSWQTHLKTTAWGPTYQLFMPYVRKGLHRASCSIAVQIDTPDGRRITSEMANIVLAGSETTHGGTQFPFTPEHQRTPAGRVHANGNHPPADDTRVVPAAAESTTSAHTTPRRADQAPKFESFSIPYNYHRAH